jgi:enoyl-CoA hydratase/carnithine racemase
MVKSVGGKRMAVVETERHGQILVVRMNRPERLNALNHEMRTELAETWIEFRESDALEVAIFIGAGRGFCAGEDMKEALQDWCTGPAAASQGRSVHVRRIGNTSDFMESRAAFAEKRAPNFKGWDDPRDRYRLPALATPRQ